MDAGGPQCDSDGYYKSVQYMWTGDFYCQSKNGDFGDFVYNNQIENYFPIDSYYKMVKSIDYTT